MTTATQHALRVAALRQRIEAGARPAIASSSSTESDRPTSTACGTNRPAMPMRSSPRSVRSNWDWKHYRPFVQLALDHDLPIVAAESVPRRGDEGGCERVGRALRHGATQAALGLDRLPAEFIGRPRARCRARALRSAAGLALAPMARAQIARDIVLARSLRPYLSRGVVLLTGNGHVRKDIGVPDLADRPSERRDVMSIGLLEAGSAATEGPGERPGTTLRRR